VAVNLSIFISPLTPLKKVGIRINIKVPLLKGDLKVFDTSLRTVKTSP
jgi:hypothetical protein